MRDDFDEENLEVEKSKVFGKIEVSARGRGERYPGTLGYRGTGQFSSKFEYRWVPWVGQIVNYGEPWYQRDIFELNQIIKNIKNS